MALDTERRRPSQRHGGRQSLLREDVRRPASAAGGTARGRALRGALHHPPSRDRRPHGLAPRLGSPRTAVGRFGVPPPPHLVGRIAALGLPRRFPCAVSGSTPPRDAI